MSRPEGLPTPEAPADDRSWRETLEGADKAARNAMARVFEIRAAATTLASGEARGGA